MTRTHRTPRAEVGGRDVQRVDRRSAAPRTAEISVAWAAARGRGFVASLPVAFGAGVECLQSRRLGSTTAVHVTWKKWKED